MKIREYFSKLRAELRKAFSHSIYDAAEFNGLAIEYWKDMGPKYDGHLDTTNEQPRFIGVDPDLPNQDQVYVIAREIGRHLQNKRVNSPVLSDTRKWDLLATAPNETRNRLLKLDLEVRAYWIMYWHAGKQHFFDFYKRNRSKYWMAFNADTTFKFVFFKLRIRNFVYSLLSTLRLVKPAPVR